MKASVHLTLVLAAMTLVASSTAHAAASPQPLRHCVLLAGEHATQGPTTTEQDNAVATNARLASSMLLPLLKADRLVANEFIVEDSHPSAVDTRVRTTRDAMG